ncbi:MAG TPA: lipoyl(octanoyl) transferase LipB [Chryseolinea sp.]|nr:lipoyl(octanoyl) transferase LipB [Chryseolinea sp.]
MNPVANKHTRYINLGLIDYQDAWNYQTSLFEKVLGVKSENRSLPENQQHLTENFLLFCQHPHVYTLGKTGKEDNLLMKTDELKGIGATYYHINRGGDITYHGPGQIVGYPIIDLENFFTDIHKYMRFLEEAVIQTISEFGVEAGRIPGLTGVWVDAGDAASARKICALGVKTSRWVTMHGFALNVNTDLNYFSHIVPCGINDKAVTSLQKELGSPLDLNEVEEILKNKIADLFGMNLELV